MPTREEIAARAMARADELRDPDSFWEVYLPMAREVLKALDADAILALLSPAPVGEWRPIESAPKDGTHVDLWGEVVGRWTNAKHNGRGWNKFSHGRGSVPVYTTMDEAYFTHWMPLPEPPSQQTAAAEAREEGR